MTKPFSSAPPVPRPMPLRARGFGLLQVLLLVAAMSGLASMGYLQWRAGAAVDSARQERQALVQADKAIIAFVTVERRLPCPDTDRDGLEDCGDVANQKGWLPSATLRLAGVDPGLDVGQLRYLVQRGAGDNSLTTLTDAWRPLEYDDGGQTFFAMRAGTAVAADLTLTDFCQRLETARTTPLAAGLAQVNAATARTVAFALAHPGTSDADGDGDLFDGANTNAVANVNRLEDPARRPLLALYNDLVLERSFDSLQAGLHCVPLMNSINTVALGLDVVTQVSEMRDGNIYAAGRAVGFSVLASVMTGIEIGLSVVEGISEAGNAAVAWVTCAASLGLAVNACAAAPQHTAAIALAGGVVYANIAAVALNATAAGIAGTALGLAIQSTPAQMCPPMDPAVTNLLAASRTAAQQEVTDAGNARDAARIERDNKIVQRDAAILAKDASIATLRSVIRGAGATSDIDNLVDPLTSAAGSWVEASFARDLAQSRLSQATNERNHWTTEVAKYPLMLANSTATITSLNADIANLNAQIAATPTPVTQAQIEALNLLKYQRDGKQMDIEIVQSIPAMETLSAEIVALDGQIATNPPNLLDLQAQRATKIRERDTNLFWSSRLKADQSLASAQAALSTATTTYNTAVSSFGTVQTSYETAFANLVNGAGRYAIRNGSGTVIRHQCTTACQVGDTNVSLAFTDAWVDLLGNPHNTLPNFAASSDAGVGKYFLVVKRQKELDALEAKLVAAETRVTNANTQLAQINGLLAAPAATCPPVTPVIPMAINATEAILTNVDRKGGTR